MTSESTSPLLENVEAAEERMHGCKYWPIVVKASLLLLGFRVNNPNRQCILHEEGQIHLNKTKCGSRSGDVHTQNRKTIIGYGSVNTDSCIVCDSLNPRPVAMTPATNKDTTSRRKRALQLMWICLVTGTFGVNFMRHIITRWGLSGMLLYTLSYTTFFGPFLAIITYRLIAMTLSCRPTGTRAVYAFTDQNVLGILNRVNLKCCSVYGYLYLILVIIYTVMSTCFNFYHYFHDCHELYSWGVFTYICEVLGMYIFAAFWFIVLLLRRSIQRDLRSVALFLKQHHEHDVACRHRIMDSFVEFSRLENLIFGWIVFQVSFVTFKVFSLLYWDYYVYSTQIKLLSNDEQIEVRLIDVVMWIEIVIFACLPLCSAGWLNIHYIWEKFLAYVEYEQTGREYWFCFKMIKHLYKGRDNISITLCGCVLSVFVSLHLSGQHARYWLGGICYHAYNTTNHTLI